MLPIPGSEEVCQGSKDQGSEHRINMKSVALQVAALSVKTYGTKWKEGDGLI